MTDKDKGQNVFELKTNKKGQRRGGRQPGTPNKTTQILKDALLNAASELGFPEEVTLLDDDGKPTGVIKLRKTGVDGMTGYLEWLGLNQPRTFAALLGRVPPTQLNIKTTSSLKVTYKTDEETRQRRKWQGATNLTALRPGFPTRRSRM